LLVNVVCVIHIAAFITGLLNNIGTHVDPIILIQKIGEGLEIPGLRNSLVQILHDYYLQVRCSYSRCVFTMFNCGGVSRGIAPSPTPSHHHHEEHAADWSVAVSMKCLQRVRF